MGIPYQTYIKGCIYDHALGVIQQKKGQAPKSVWTQSNADYSLLISETAGTVQYSTDEEVSSNAEKTLLVIQQALDGYMRSKKPKSTAQSVTIQTLPDGSVVLGGLAQLFQTK